MKIAISNLAWETQETDAIAEIMASFSIKGVEIAPTKVWPNPLAVSSSQAKDYKYYWQNRGIQIVAMQSLLFGRRDLTIFQSQEKRLETKNYLTSLIKLAQQLGAEVLVFGSPQNRLIGDLAQEVVTEIAVDFFSHLGKVASSCGVKFCLEPNPQVYNCDFINTSTEGYALVTQVDSPGFGLHLDTAAMTLAQEAIAISLKQVIDQLCHFHISEPNLQPINSLGVPHELFAQTLTNLNYQGWTSIEMLGRDNNLLNVTNALDIATKYYDNNNICP